jgi:radical SAM superfamily enzyme YgiQ (UPF0313 family)
MIKVGFILPSSDYLYDPFRGDPHTHFQILTVLDSKLEGKVNNSLIDLRGVNKKFAKYRIPECDLFLHSTYTLDWIEQKEIVKELRIRYPQSKHIAGGPHTSSFQEDSLQVFDSIVLGDGEDSIIQAIHDFSNLNLKRVYEQKGKIDVNKYPFPLRHYLPEATISRPGLLNLKNKQGLDKLLTTTVIFSRGCTDNCAFCAMPNLKKYNPGVRFREPKSIENEIQYLKNNYRVQGISLLDEIAFPQRKELAKPYLEAIGKTGIPWKGQCRVNNIDIDTSKMLRDSGNIITCMGVESASQMSLDMINKRIKVEDSKQAIRLLKENGIETRVYMILGLPGEPLDIGKKTWDFIRETDPASVYLSLFTIRPGTDVFNNPKKYGIKAIDKDWTKTMHMYGRYEKERPRLTFEYEKNPFWGKSMNKDKIVDTYLELQEKIINNGYGPL